MVIMTNYIDRHRFTRTGFILFVLGGLLLITTAARAQTVDDEFNFASGLVEWGFSDLALRLVDNLAAAQPQVAERANLIRAQSLIASRKFADAEGIIAQLPSGSAKADAIRLALANAYYATGDIDKSRDIYNNFFGRYKEKPTDADLLRFYRDAAYRYAVMLERASDWPGALAAYDRVLSTDPERDLQRRIMMDKAQVLVRLAQANHEGKRDDYAVQARKVVEQIQWGGVDLWFGQSIIVQANIELIYNDEAKAQQGIKESMDILKQIDKLLEENNMPKGLSPMAGARFLSGQISERAAERAASANNDAEALKNYGAALTEYYNVFVQYGESDVGPEAGVKAQTIKDILEHKYGRKVNIDLGERASDAAATVFRLGDTLYRERKYKEAIEAYLPAINQFPEQDVTIRALSNLMLCYANLDDVLMVRTLASYIAERFPSRPEGANALLAGGKFYVDKDRADLYTELYESFLKTYPQHDRAGTILFYLASQRKKAGDEAGAASYFRRIIDNYPKDQYYTRALNQVAWSYYQAKEYEPAIEYFRRLIKESLPGPDQAQAQFNLADSLVRLERFPEAAAEFTTLIRWLSGQRAEYIKTPADESKIKDLLEKASFQLATSLARINEPAGRVPEFRDQSIKAYDLFVQKFGGSELAPRALNGKGTVLLELKRFDEATKTFDELAARYPNSEEGKNALFSLARAAMEIKQFDQGVAAFNRMMNDASRYQPEEFVRLGAMMGDAGYAKEAIAAYIEVQKKIGALPQSAQDAQRPLIERSLFGSARAYFQAGMHKEAVEAADALLTKYPQSGLFYETKFIQGESLRELGRHADAVLALNDVFRYATDSALINRATVKLAEIQRLHGDKTEALASYQRLALLADRNNPDNRTMIEDAILASVEIAAELGRTSTVIENADDYAQLFPQGRYLDRVRSLRSEAMLKAASAPQ